MTKAVTSEIIALENEAYAYRKSYKLDEMIEAWQQWRKEEEKASGEKSPQH